MSKKYHYECNACGKAFDTDTRGQLYCDTTCEAMGPSAEGLDGAAEAAEETVTLTKAQYQQLIEAKAANPNMTAEQMMSFITTVVTELRKPDPETAERMALEKMKKKEAREVRIREIEAEQNARKARQEACTHKTEKGRSVISGQVHADGLHHPICQRCGREFQPRPPIGELGTTALTTWNFGSTEEVAV